MFWSLCAFLTTHPLQNNCCCLHSACSFPCTASFPFTVGLCNVYCIGEAGQTAAQQKNELVFNNPVTITTTVTNTTISEAPSALPAMPPAPVPAANNGNFSNPMFGQSPPAYPPLPSALPAAPQVPATLAALPPFPPQGRASGLTLGGDNGAAPNEYDDYRRGGGGAHGGSSNPAAYGGYGQPQTTLCIQCNAVLEFGKKFCAHCGAPQKN